jgi:predicted O-linked N-acetylglucosamine transferase (SPINDLY family)
MGLPEDAFVFCCFNLPKKLDRETFASWLRILKAADKSVLWLLEMDETMKSSLRQEFAAAGLDPGRLVIATRLPLDQHLARHRCADLFLDNFIYGAQTTACDALRAGLPLLTLYGSTFVSRASASVLAAAGLPELICRDVSAYEQTAIALARDAAKLAGFRQRLSETRETAPLFDVDRFRRSFEAGLEHIVTAARAGRKPENVAVRDLL